MFWSSMKSRQEYIIHQLTFDRALEHDKEQLVAACEELFDIDAKHMKLKAHVRRLAWQLLGMPPDYQETPIREMLGLDRPQP
jgi:hypothetical protein